MSIKIPSKDPESWFQKYKSHLFFVIILCAAGVVIYQAVDFYRNQFGSDLAQRREAWGLFGDYFGGMLNPILSFLALIALLYTIILQSAELKATRDELEKSSDALTAQSDSLRLQNFENRFFKLIELHKNSASNLKSTAATNHHKVDIHGKACFEVFYREFSDSYNNIDFSDFVLKSELRKILKCIDKTFSKFDIHYYFYEHADILDSLLFESQSISLHVPMYENIIKRQYNKYELFFLYFFHCKYLNSCYIDTLKNSKFFENIDLSLFPNLGPDILLIYGREVFGKLNDKDVIGSLLK